MTFSSTDTTHVRKQHSKATAQDHAGGLSLASQHTSLADQYEGLYVGWLHLCGHFLVHLSASIPMGFNSMTCCHCSFHQDAQPHPFICISSCGHPPAPESAWRAHTSVTGAGSVLAGTWFTSGSQMTPKQQIEDQSSRTTCSSRHAGDGADGARHGAADAH